MENEANTACTVACCADNNFIGFVTVIVIRSIARCGFRFVPFDKRSIEQSCFFLFLGGEVTLFRDKCRHIMIIKIMWLACAYLIRSS